MGQNIKGHNRIYKRLLLEELGKLEELEEENGLTANLLSRKAFIQGELMKLLEMRKVIGIKEQTQISC